MAIEHDTIMKKYLVLCEGRDTESFLINYLISKELRYDVQQFVDQIKNRYSSVSTHEHKSRLHTYFSVNEGFISLKIGEAAAAGAFDWDNDKLIPLRAVLEEGFVR